MLVSVFTRCTPLNWGTLGYNKIKGKDTGRVLEIKKFYVFLTREEFDVNE